MPRFFAKILVFFLLISTLAHAEKIVDIDFNGLTTVPENIARGRMTLVEGSEYSASAVKSDIKKLYDSGLFGDVAVDKQKVAGGIKLTFTVTEKRTIGKLTISGNKKIDDDDLAEAIKIHEFELLDPSKLAETKAAMYKLYEDKGMYLVDIKTSIEPFDDDNNQVELLIKIKENRPVKIKRIRFVGNSVYSDKKLRGEFKTKEKSLLSFLTSGGKLKSDKLAADVKLLQYYYLDNGYLKVKISEPNVTLSRDRQSIYISIPVHEGLKYTVADVDVQGDILTTREEILKASSLKIGKPYRKSLEIADMQMLERLYGDQAYAFANIVPNVEANDGDQTARVTYYVQKGPKIKVGRIQIKGNAVTHDKVIRREMRLIENSYYSQSALELSRTRLYQLGFFEEVNISTPRGLSENVVDVVVDVKEKNTGTFSIGAGFSTLESFIFTATVQKENFFGLGISGGISANVSKLRQDIMVNIADPHFLDTNWYLGASFTKFQSQLNSDFDQDRFGGTVSFGREVFDFFHMRVGYEIDQVEVTNFSAQVPQFFQDNASGLTSAVTATITYDRRDNRMATKKGVYTTASAEWSSHVFGASNNYVRFSQDNRVFFKLPLNFVLKGRGMFGYINSLDSQPVPLFERYFLGGINTLRGFNLHTVGPTLDVPASATGGDTSFTYGGNKMMLFNTELEVPLYAPAGFYAVTFIDAGNAFAEDQNLDFSNLRYNYGFGLRWQSPFGPLRFEWGLPIDKRSDEAGVVFNFSIGQNF